MARRTTNNEDASSLRRDPLFRIALGGVVLFIVHRHRASVDRRSFVRRRRSPEEIRAVPIVDSDGISADEPVRERHGRRRRCRAPRSFATASGTVTGRQRSELREWRLRARQRSRTPRRFRHCRCRCTSSRCGLHPPTSRCSRSSCASSAHISSCGVSGCCARPRCSVARSSRRPASSSCGRTGRRRVRLRSSRSSSGPSSGSRRSDGGPRPRRSRWSSRA